MVLVIVHVAARGGHRLGVALGAYVLLTSCMYAHHVHTPIRIMRSVHCYHELSKVYREVHMSIVRRVRFERESPAVGSAPCLFDDGCHRS